MSPDSTPQILSGPFGSLVTEQFGLSTKQAFAADRVDAIRAILRQYRDSGVTQPVTPTFAAAVRGPHGGTLTSDLRAWNTNAAFLTRDVFGDKKVFGSVAPFLNTDGTDDLAWRLMGSVDRAKSNHVPQMQALYDGDIRMVLGEAFHDDMEMAGFIAAADETGMERAIVAAEPLTKNKQFLPNHLDDDLPLSSSFQELLLRLQDRVRGELRIGIGLNCGNIETITEIVEKEAAGTFAAVYPNQCVVPPDQAQRFFALAHRNHERTDEQDTEFQSLRRLYEIQQHQLERMIQVCLTKEVEHIGLCCGASPAHIRSVAAALRQLTPDASLQSLPSESLDRQIQYRLPLEDHVRVA